MKRGLLLLSICLLLVLTVTAGAAPAKRADACTSFSVVAKDGAILIGRSLEFGLPLESKVMIVPRDFKFTSPAPDGKEGLSWQAKYGFVGMNTRGLDLTPDGLNEAGLSVGLLYLPGFAKYQQVGPKDTSRALANLEECRT